MSDTGTDTELATPQAMNERVEQALIREGHSRRKALQARGCCLVGHPGYYGGVGFENVADLVHEGVPPEVFFVPSFDGHVPKGTVTFHQAFKAAGSAPARS